MTSIVLQTTNLVKRFGEVTAVDGLSLAVQEGEVFGFLGPNGAGKTTSISMMCGLLAPDSGTVTIRGTAIHNGDDVRTKVGVCPQSIVIWPFLTCIEQLIFIGEMYGLSATVAKAHGEILLETLGLSEKRNKLAKTLSGGMQRRLNLLLALVHDPELVVLDEPEAGLDPQSRVLVREYIHSLARKKTIILTTHNMDEAERVADRVAIIDHGKLLAMDTPEQLKRQYGKGDILELDWMFLSEEQQTAIRNVFDGKFSFVSLTGNRLEVQERDIATKLPAILEVASHNGGAPSRIQLRENSLEDVFIAMTGRGLRE
ncbi:MAG: ABC transporter ATP-binding protein [bacterium]|nr:ABC transporter ATP-binding protein [bacterium]